VQQRRAGRVLLPGEVDGSPCELDRAWRRTGLAGELGGPGAQLGEVEPGEPGCVGHGGPERERPLQVSSGLRQAEQGLRLACRFDRGGQRLRTATRGRPVRRELRRCCGRGAREFAGEPCVQLLALAREDRRVDRLGQERVAEAEGARGLVGDEDLMLDGVAQRRAHLVLRKRRDRMQQRVADVASGGCRHAQQALGRRVEPGYALQQHVAQVAWDLAVPAAGGSEEFFGEEGVAFGPGDDRIGQRDWRGGIRVSRE
jgi:hypothetical protein